MTFDQGIGLIREFGFPVFVVMWFMFRVEKRLDRLFELTTALMTTMKILAQALNNHSQELRAGTSPPTPPPEESEKEQS